MLLYSFIAWSPEAISNASIPVRNQTPKKETFAEARFHFFVFLPNHLCTACFIVKFRFFLLQQQFNSVVALALFWRRTETAIKSSQIVIVSATASCAKVLMSE